MLEHAGYLETGLMRIALHPSAEVGTRVGLILLAEHSLVTRVVRRHRGLGSNRRTMKISALSGFDVFVTDDPDPVPLVAIAAEDGLSCVVAGSIPPAVAARLLLPAAPTIGADLKGIAVRSPPTGGADEGSVDVNAAWTIPGKALRRGAEVGFPEPVGARWGVKVNGGIEVPVGGSWAAAAQTSLR